MTTRIAMCFRRLEIRPERGNLPNLQYNIIMELKTIATDRRRWYLYIRTWTTICTTGLPKPDVIYSSRTHNSLLFMRAYIKYNNSYNGLSFFVYFIQYYFRYKVDSLRRIIHRNNKFYGLYRSKDWSCCLMNIFKIYMNLLG